jgi:hypothetical protein
MFWAVIGSFLLGTGVGITVGFYVAEREWRKKSFQSGRIVESGSDMESLPDSMVEVCQEERRKVPESSGDASLWKVHRYTQRDQ